MSKVNEMSLKEILDITNVIMYKNDIIYCCDNTDVINEFKRQYKELEYKSEEIKKFILDNKDFIDKEKFILLLAQNYKENLEMIDMKEEYLKEESKNNFSLEEILKEFSDAEKQKKVQTMFFKSTVNLTRNIDKIINLYDYDEEKNRYVIKVISSKNFLNKKEKHNNKNKKRFDKLDKDIKDKDVEHKSGIEFIISPLTQYDLEAVFFNDFIGKNIINITKENEVLRKGISTNEELCALKSKNNIEEYENILNSISIEELLQKLKDTLREYSDYLDIDKLLLISAYRYNQGLENKIYDTVLEAVQEILTIIKDNIESRNVAISYNLQDAENEKDIQLNYSVKDLENCLKRFIDGKYMTNDDINNEKENLINGNTKLADINSQLLSLINLTEEEKDTVMYSNLENFIYGVKSFDYDIDQMIGDLNENKNIPLNYAIRCLYEENKVSVNSAIDLYNKGTIGREFFKKFSEEIDTSSEINLQKINEQYLKIKAQQPNEEETNKLNTLLELYRVVNIDDKTQKEKEEHSNDIMYEIAEDFEDENDLLFYYINGLLTLNTVAEWGGDELIERLYNKSKITFKDLEKLYNSKTIKQSTIEKAILKDEIDEEKLNLYVSLRYLSDDAIIKLRKDSKFHIKDAKEWEKQGLISQQLLKRLEDIDIKELEDKSNTHASDLIEINDTGEEFREFAQEDIEKFSDEEDIDEFLFELDLSGLEGKEKKDLIKSAKEKSIHPSVSGEKTIGVIDPNVRLAFLKALGCKVPQKLDMGNHPENSPFKDYNIFIISEDEKELKKDSIIIAEQLYKNKEDKRELAIDSATYIMRWEDLCILNNNPKDEQKGKLKVLEERDGVIYRTYHRTKGMIETLNALEEKEDSEYVNIKTGSWAKNVLKKVAYAKAGGKIKGKHDDEALAAYRYLEKIHKNEDIMEIVKKRYMENKSKYKNKQLGQAVMEIAREEGFISGNESEEMAIYNCLRTMYTVEKLNKIAILVDYIDNGIPPSENILRKENEISSVEFPVWELIRDVPQRSKKGFDQTDDDDQR